MAVEVPAAGLSLSESHPLSEELSSLRALVAHFHVLLSFLVPLVLLEQGRTVTVLVRFSATPIIHSSLMLNYLFLYELELTKQLQNEAHTASITSSGTRSTPRHTPRESRSSRGEQAPARRARRPPGQPRPTPLSSLQSGAPSSVFSSAFASPLHSKRGEAREKDGSGRGADPRAARALRQHTLALASLSTATQSLTEPPCGRARRSTPQTKRTRSPRGGARGRPSWKMRCGSGGGRGRAREEARRSDAVVREYAGLVRRLEGRSPAAGRTSFALGHTRGVSGSGSVDAGSTPTLVEPAYSSFAPAPAATNGDADAKPTSDLEAGPNDALDWEKRAAALTASCTTLELALAASHTLVAELGTELARAKYEREVARIEDGGAGRGGGTVYVRMRSVASLPFLLLLPLLPFWAVFTSVAGEAAALHISGMLVPKRSLFSFSFFPVHMHRRVFGRCFSPRGFLGRIPSPRPTPLATSSPLFLLLQHLLHFFLRQARPAGSLTRGYEKTQASHVGMVPRRGGTAAFRTDAARGDEDYDGVSSTCYARSALPESKAAFLAFKKTLVPWLAVAFGLVAVHIGKSCFCVVLFNPCLSRAIDSADTSFGFYC
ncbi:hypothetical protein B0H14DRAFT_3732908 [Mycena olivaceomarginata]|nr:hypothetical protein B0H14DRAFT_3732908 [Mycena olivaceomarginata]